MYPLIIDINFDRKKIVSELKKQGIKGLAEGYAIHRLFCIPKINRHMGQVLFHGA